MQEPNQFTTQGQNPVVPNPVAFQGPNPVAFQGPNPVAFQGLNTVAVQGLNTVAAQGTNPPVYLLVVPNRK